jgi:hypothetical protein
VNAIEGQNSLIRDVGGQFQIPAEMLAERFGWSMQTLQEMMHRGLVASNVECGEGEDSGQWRLSVRSGNRRWRVTVQQDGRIIGQEFDIVPLKRR